jgi:ribonuclease BN (tRNA processing enzyme)
LLDTKDHYIILDAGNGFYKLDQYMTQDKPVSLFISHFHIDHVSGLHTLGKFNFSKGIDVYVGLDRKRDFETLVNPPYTIGFQSHPENIKNLPYEIRLHELKENNNDLPFPLEVIKQHHAYDDHSFRFTLENKILAYSGDCGISENSKSLTRFADVLIHECSLITPEENNVWGHVDPSQAATLAKETGVKKLFLTHFDARQYDTLDKRVKAEKQAQSIFPETQAAYDDLIITL